jgi:tRNA(fMet)-specific endonuclease VapC
MILLDTDIISQLLRPEPPPPLVQRLRAVPTRRRHISAISIAELLYGIERTGRHEEIRAGLEANFISRIEVLSFDLEAARVYARIRAHLAASGRPLAEADLQIASVASAHGLILITGNERHFRRVPRLRVENWLRE